MKNNISKKESIIYNTFVIIGILLICYYVLLKIVFGFIAFSNMFCLFGIVLLTYGAVELKFSLNLWRRIPKKIRVLITLLFSVGIAIFIAVEAVIFYHGHHYDKVKPDYVIVLGAGLRGNKISASLKYRLDTALEFNEQYSDVQIIVSGGKGNGENTTEAFAMKNYLVANGVSDDLIIMEEKSTTTYENFLYTKEILENSVDIKDISVTIISNNFHMYRAKILAENMGYETLGYPAPSHKASSLVFHVREFFGVLKALFMKK